MSDPKLAAVILAAGKGTRMKSERAKVLHTLLGRPMFRYVLDAAEAAGASRRLLVVGHQAEEVRRAAPEGVEFALQAEQRGTGHAVLAGLKALGDFSGQVLILNGDMPLLTGSLLSRLVARHRQAGAELTLATARVPAPSDFGRVVRDADGRVARVVEARDDSRQGLTHLEVNLGTYCAEAELLRSLLPRLRAENAQGELYFTDVPGMAVREGRRVESVACPDPELGLGINTRADLARVAAVLNRRLLQAWMLEGVTVLDPATTWVEPGVQMGRDTVLMPFTILEGNTVIGQRCTIGPGAQITDSRVEDGARIQHSVLQGARVGPEATVGPFAYLRPGANIGPRVRVGDFVEIKNSTVEADAKVPHLSYVGDAHIGPRVNLGCGTITCNFDGARKHRTIIEEGAFIGSNTSLVAPVTVGREAATGAGAVVTRDVPPHTLVVGIPARPLRDLKKNPKESPTGWENATPRTPRARSPEERDAGAGR